MKEEMKKEEIKKEELKEEIKVDENSIEETQSVEKPRLLKGFRIEKETNAAGNVRYKMIIQTLLDRETSLYLKETEYVTIDFVGIKNCYVNLERRYSAEKRINYYVVALHCADEVLDLFVKDRAFSTLALLHAKSVLGEDFSI